MIQVTGNPHANGRRGRNALFLALALVTALGAPGNAPAEERFDIVDAAAFTGDVWAAYRFETDHGAVQLEATETLEGARVAAVGVWVVTRDGDGYPIYFDEHRGFDKEVRLRAPEPLGLDIEVNEEARFSGRLRLTVTGRFTTSGECTLVVVMASDGASEERSLQFKTSPSSTLVATTKGSEAFVHTEHDFAPRWFASVAPMHPARARAYADGELTKVVDGRLFGMFSNGGETALLWTDRPDGTTSPRDQFFIGDAPGPYRFRIQAAAEVAGSTATTLWGAGVQLP